MANVIFTVCASLFVLVMLFILIRAAYYANFNRPFRIALANLNDSKSAKEVDVEPYLQIIVDQFPHMLDSKSNG